MKLLVSLATLSLCCLRVQKMQSWRVPRRGSFCVRCHCVTNALSCVTNAPSPCHSIPEQLLQGLGAAWDSGSVRAHGRGWHWMGSKVPPSPNHSGIPWLTFCSVPGQNRMGLQLLCCSIPGHRPLSLAGAQEQGRLHSVAAFPSSRSFSPETFNLSFSAVTSGLTSGLHA